MVEDKQAKLAEISGKMALIESGRGTLTLNVLVDTKYDASYWSRRLGLPSELLRSASMTSSSLVQGKVWMCVKSLDVDEFYIGDWRLVRIYCMLSRLGINSGDPELKRIKQSILLNLVKGYIKKVVVEEMNEVL